jgi:hypothetical protein
MAKALRCREWAGAVRCVHVCACSFRLSRYILRETWCNEMMEYPCMVSLVVCVLSACVSYTTDVQPMPGVLVSPGLFLTGFDTFTALGLCAGYSRVTHALTRMQAAWRGRADRHAFARLRACCVVTQAWYRGCRARSTLRDCTRVHGHEQDRDREGQAGEGTFVAHHDGGGPPELHATVASTVRTQGRGGTCSCTSRAWPFLSFVLSVLGCAL